MRSDSKQYRVRFQWLVIVVAFVLTVLMSVQPALADNLYGSIRGTVTDPSGAAVPNASIVATNNDTGIQTKITSGSNGIYVLQQLAVGTYSVTITAPNFKTFRISGLHLDVAQVYTLEAKLELGAVAEAIEVSANAVQVESTDMQLGATVEGSQIVDIPLNGRNWTALQQLQPGVVGTTDRFGGANGAFSGNGQETQQNSFLINGVDSNDPTLNTALVIPSPDAIGEFRMVMNTLNPEYGRNSGTVINAVIKNGTNAFHGSGFEFYRDTFLDGKGWFRPSASPFHQNEYGGTVGGPIVKDRAFFFFSYQGLKNRQPQVGANPSVPVYTAQERTGNFSDLGPFFNAGNPEPAGSPCGAGYTGPFGPNPLPFNVGAATAGTPWCTAFPTGDLSATNGLNPLAVTLMGQFVPNTGGNFSFNPTTVQTYNQYLYRIDYKLGSKDALWFYNLFQTNPSTDSLPFTGATVPGFAEKALRHQKQYSVAWNHTFTGTTLNEARFGYTRFNFAAVDPVSTIDPTAFGFTGISPQNRQFEQLPLMTVAGLFTLGFSNNGPQPRIQDTYQLVDNFTKVWGRHNFKAGVSIDINQVNNPFFNNLNGNFAFSGAGPFSTNAPGADFLMGLPDTYSQGSGSTVRERGHEYYAYFQDQWQVRRNLTLTLGTGWDVETPWRNEFANGEIMSAFRPGQQSTVFPTAPVGFVFPGDTGINKYGGMTVHYGEFAPRVGFAWSPGSSQKWSVRGGVGLYYNRSESELSLQTLTNAPFALTSVAAGAVSSPGFVNPYVTANPAPVGALGCANAGATGGCSAEIANPFPFAAPTPGSPVNFSQYFPIGLGTVVNDPRTTAPRATNYNLTIERQLDKATIVSVGYVGSQARHLEGAFVLNLAGEFPGINPDAVAFGCPNGFAMTSGACPTSGQPGGTPLPLGVYGQTGFETTEYNSKYNSLQVSLNRHFSGGLQFLASYTWSRYFDQTSNLENSAFNFPGINSFDPHSMWAPSQNDAPQRLVVSYTYTLPFYKFGHHWKRLTDDWNLSGIYTLQHGTPVGVFNLLSTSDTCDLNVSFFACPDRVDYTGVKLNRVNPRTAQFDSLGNNLGNFLLTNGTPAVGAPQAAFTATPGSIGFASRNPFYGPGTNYSDLALEKNIHIDEARYVQLRLETFNTFNHANFANPLTPGFNSEDAGPIGAAVLGRIFRTQTISTNGDGRVLQLGAKFYF
jgi:hypothetical protein